MKIKNIILISFLSIGSCLFANSINEADTLKILEKSTTQKQHKNTINVNNLNLHKNDVYIKQVMKITNLKYKKIQNWLLNNPNKHIWAAKKFKFNKDKINALKNLDAKYFKEDINKNIKKKVKK